MKNLTLALLGVFLLACQATSQREEKFKALIIDGSNNHYVWPKTTQMMKSYFEETSLFEVDIKRMDTIWLGVKYNPNRPEAYESFISDHPAGNQAITKDPLKVIDFKADFGAYDLIVLNVGERTPNWPDETKRAFENHIKNGGGLVVVHAANNAWGDWEAYNEMIGLGGWGNRDSTSGPAAYYDEKGALIVNSAADTCATHGPETEYVITTRAPDHPIMQGIPESWLHTRDEMYAKMRGPFKNATILATAYSDPEKETAPWDATVRGSGRNEPMLLAIEYGQGRIYHSVIGHFDYSQECVGFITLLQRGAEWAVTGKVTQAIPEDFPTADQSSARSWKSKG